MASVPDIATPAFRGHAHAFDFDRRPPSTPTRGASHRSQAIVDWTWTHEARIWSTGPESAGVAIGSRLSQRCQRHHHQLHLQQQHQLEGW